MIRTYIALGSNLNDPLGQVEKALQHLRQLPHCELGAISPWYRSKAVGPGAQPDYINGAAEIGTSLDAEQFLKALQQIEALQGRTRQTHSLQTRWGPRTLDLDLLLYGEALINTPFLQVPHPRMKERNFVLYPLYDINPTLCPKVRHP